ncbi:hypothetical protein DW776_00080 [Ruminococcus sp. AM30-15AC]|nr:hypothetical protein DXD97_01780 [Ruminococcus sp. TM10-9AT]RGW23270.1 hypothetical protein DWV90_01380 [Ruminococcus sp. AF13-37]RGW24772.1 hypothetical protein DWV87_00075 [Ruminococcus sp. AF13-28]RGY85950.1 hypothetical protein DXA17_18640 [Ruminococcus sp. AM58-7XD]RHD97098.1 hypothetical protein DW776_00080 [Ruminococcus sp. AM30-15AC]RHO81412.1 hypothetical protein DW061_19735 [Ruminococcus sp. AF42-9BH]RHT54900.1 hypothetical protein DW768_01270 [Ruminococcus sp. AM29-26]
MRDFNRIKQVAAADCEYLIDPDQPGCQNRLWIIKLVKKLVWNRISGRYGSRIYRCSPGRFFCNQKYLIYLFQKQTDFQKPGRFYHLYRTGRKGS